MLSTFLQAYFNKICICYTNFNYHCKTKHKINCYMQGCQDMPLTIPRYSTTQKKVNTVMHYANSIAHYRNCVAHNKEKTLSLLGLDSRMILMIISLNKVYSKTIFSRYLVFSRYILPCTDAQKVHTNTNISV